MKKVYPITLLQSTLSKTYPYWYSQRFARNWCIGLSCFIFLMNLLGNKMQGVAIEGIFILIVGLFSIMVASVCFLFHLGLMSLFKNRLLQKNWTVKHQITANLVLIALVFLINSVLLSLQSLTFSFKTLFVIIGQMAITCIAFVTLLEYFQDTKQKLIKTLSINQELLQINEKLAQPSHDFVQLRAKSGGEKIEVAVEKILYLKACGNYVEIYTETSKDILRTPMNSLVEPLAPFLAIQRCHRSYFVNVKQVQTVQGNSHKLILTLKDGQSKIPVSKSYYSTLTRSPLFDPYKKCLS